MFAAVAGGLTVWCVLAAMIALGGYEVGVSLRAMVGGAIGSWDAFTSATLVRSTPLILAGLGIALAFRGGVLNIGAEGQLLVGAASATGVLLALSSAPRAVALPVALLAAGAAGATWAALPAWLRLRFGVLEVISTIMMNFLASDFVSWLVRGPLQEPTHVYPQSPSIDAALRLPTFGPGSRLHWGFVIALLFAAVCAFGLRHLAIGFRLRLVGANPSAAWVTGGVRVAKVTAASFLISGALAGLAGGVEVTGVTFALYENLSPGFGYTAIAVALLAGLDPLWVVPSAIVFGALEAGGAAMQRDAGVPSGFVAVVEATIMLALLAGRVLFPGITRAPWSATVTSEASS